MSNKRWASGKPGQRCSRSEEQRRDVNLDNNNLGKRMVAVTELAKLEGGSEIRGSRKKRTGRERTGVMEYGQVFLDHSQAPVDQNGVLTAYLLWLDSWIEDAAKDFENLVLVPAVVVPVFPAPISPCLWIVRSLDCRVFGLCRGRLYGNTTFICYGLGECYPTPSGKEWKMVVRGSRGLRLVSLQERVRTTGGSPAKVLVYREPASLLKWSCDLLGSQPRRWGDSAVCRKPASPLRQIWLIEG
ncbi:hypothetical protein CRG98_020306 [Punica granatum]|uniref:Uncharacterized protein n=1 Tax=Punica granatum TaxID=22663 RepID=A0A2I0JSP1_PUNGR|nr:hypothetical protein CRG98_020306 [Punica granatum]